MKEIFKDIPGYEKLYQISNCGKIKSLYNYKRNGTNILIPKIKRGYYQIGLRKNGTRKWYLVHRLVALAFLENKNNFNYINHKDENKLNNNVLADATKQNGIKSIGNISMCCNGKYKQAHGYVWKYKEVVSQ